LNQWDHLLEYANSKGNTNPHLVLESAWRVPNWALMKDALSQVGAPEKGLERKRNIKGQIQRNK